MCYWQLDSLLFRLTSCLIDSSLVRPLVRVTHPSFNPPIRPSLFGLVIFCTAWALSVQSELRLYSTSSICTAWASSELHELRLYSLSILTVFLYSISFVCIVLAPSVRHELHLYSVSSVWTGWASSVQSFHSHRFFCTAWAPSWTPRGPPGHLRLSPCLHPASPPRTGIYRSTA